MAQRMIPVKGALKIFSVKLSDGNEVTIPASPYTTGEALRDEVAIKLGLKNKEIFSVWVVGSNYAEYKTYPLEYALNADDKPHKLMDEWNVFHKKYAPSKTSLSRSVRKHTQKIKAECELVLKLARLHVRRYERNTKDPIAIMLLYNEAKALFLRGLLPVSLDEVAHMAAVTLRMEHPEVESLDPLVPFDLSGCLPCTFIKKTGVDSAMLAKINTELATIGVGKSDKILQLLYLLSARRCPRYGSILYRANIVYQKTRSEGYIGVSSDGLTFSVDRQFDLLPSIRFDEIEKLNMIGDTILLQANVLNAQTKAREIQQYAVEGALVPRLMEHLQDQWEFKKLERRLVRLAIEQEKQKGTGAHGGTQHTGSLEEEEEETLVARSRADSDVSNLGYATETARSVDSQESPSLEQKFNWDKVHDTEYAGSMSNVTDVTPPDVSDTESV